MNNCRAYNSYISIKHLDRCNPSQYFARVLTTRRKARLIHQNERGHVALEASSFRSRFPKKKKKVYLNSCSQGALSQDVETAIGEWLASWHQEGSPWDLWVDQYEAGRASCCDDQCAPGRGRDRGERIRRRKCSGQRPIV